MLLKSFLVSYCWLITDRWLDVAKCAKKKKKTLNVVSLAYSMYKWSKTELKVSSYRKGDKMEVGMNGNSPSGLRNEGGR